MSFSAAILAVLSMTNFSTGIGEWHPHPTGMAAVTDDENKFIERVLPELDRCTDDQCRVTIGNAILETLNLRRKLHSTFVGDLIFNDLRGPCEQLDGHAIQQRDCFKDVASLTFEQGMRRDGFHPAGVTLTGYSQLRIGLRHKEVRFILGSDGDEVSYVSSGSYAVGTYRWKSGRGSIVAVFDADDELRGRSEIGLR